MKIDKKVTEDLENEKILPSQKSQIGIIHYYSLSDSEIQNFTMSVTGMYRRDAMLRQVSEAMALGNAKVGTIINTKKEWNYV